MSGIKRQKWRLALTAILILHKKVSSSRFMNLDPDTCERRRLRIPSAAFARSQRPGIAWCLVLGSWPSAGASSSAG